MKTITGGVREIVCWIKQVIIMNNVLLCLPLATLLLMSLLVISVYISLQLYQGGGEKYKGRVTKSLGRQP